MVVISNLNTLHFPQTFQCHQPLIRYQDCLCPHHTRACCSDRLGSSRCEIKAGVKETHTEHISSSERESATTSIYSTVPTTVHSFPSWKLPPRSTDRWLLRIHARSWAFVCVLVLAGRGLIFFLVAGIVLCFGFRMKIMLITHGWFSC